MGNHIIQPTPLNSLGVSAVYRAFVSLPEYMQDEDRRPLQERTVFFEVPRLFNPPEHLALLLKNTWNIETYTWLELGYIYNVYSVNELMRINISDDPELRVLETGGGPDGIHYAKQCDVDLFVTPRVAQRLQELLIKSRL